MPARKSTNRKPPKESPAAARQADAEQQLDSFLAKYDPEVAAFARRALAKMRKLVPGAVEMVYDNYDWLVVGFSPTERHRRRPTREHVHTLHGLARASEMIHKIHRTVKAGSGSRFTGCASRIQARERSHIIGRELVRVFVAESDRNAIH